MSQPTRLGHGVPETDAPLAPTFLAAALVLAALLSTLSPLVAAAVGGALVATVGWSLRRALRERTRGARPLQTPAQRRTAPR
ncbi:hypothetical protein [Halobaculum marinum]|uniref:Uncharacterized protein n=1 Tax=Halobaculum marinum TaxID=3031996 RepID=A0ABD5WSL9_9EURY|nr:hypothetical protein [Halobaculum sp. DT55]